MTEITIEKINGKERTIIRKPFDAEWVKEQLCNGTGVTVELCNLTWRTLSYYDSEDDLYCGYLSKASASYIVNTITILPPLPKHPKSEDAPLLHLYAANGLTVCSEHLDNATPPNVVKFHFVGCGKKGIYTEFNPPLDCKNHLNWWANYPLTHATLSGEYVEIAIEGECDE